MADKLLASTPDFLITALVQSASILRKVSDVPRQAFTPPPRVTSTILHLTWKKWAPDDWLRYEHFLDKLYLHKRKQIQSILRKEYPNLSIDNLLKTSQIAPHARAHQLEVRQLVELFFLLTKQLP